MDGMEKTELDINHTQPEEEIRPGAEEAPTEEAMTTTASSESLAESSPEEAEMETMSELYE